MLLLLLVIRNILCKLANVYRSQLSLNNALRNGNLKTNLEAVTNRTVFTVTKRMSKIIVTDFKNGDETEQIKVQIFPFHYFDLYFRVNRRQRE